MKRHFLEMITKKTKEHTPMIQHPLSGSCLTNLLELLLQNGRIEKKYILKVLSVSVFSFFSIPLRLFETVKFGKKIENTQLTSPPIFIIGHWRSGTTYFHRLMTQDKNLGYISSFQAFLPKSSLGIHEILESQLKKIWPEVRMMDNVTYSPDVPEEEEYALGNLLTLSFYHCWYFPKNMKKCFKQSVLLDGISESQRNKWKDAYIRILRKASFIWGGKRLVVKNPANTARISVLLEMFPDAKFIHIYRNPYDVYASTKNFYEKLLPRYKFQDVTDEEIKKNIFIFYRELMQRFFDSMSAIPPENFVEIKFEDFEVNEIEELRRIYRQLNLPGFEEAEENFRRYIDSHSSYKKNEYVLDENTRREIELHWKFAIDRWQSLVNRVNIQLPT